MDSVTHIVLGACIGEALLGKKIGRRAMLLGAIAQSLPDIDAVASFWMDPAEFMMAHRGITHSLLFIILISLLLAALSGRIYRKFNVPFKQWLLLFGSQMLIHIFLDTFNNYGTGWFEPFSSMRLTFNAIYVADPLFTIFPLVASIVLLFLKPSNPRRSLWWKMPVIACTLYLGYSLFNKSRIDNKAKDAFARQHIPHDRYFTTPAPLQNILWMVVAGNDSGFNVGYRSLLDKDPEIRFQYFPVNRSYIDTLIKFDDVIHLMQFSQGFYTVEKWSDTLVFNDLRFGQIIGWQDPKEKFVFHYFLRQPGANKLVVQRGRFAKWDKDVLTLFFRRIWGN